ncbi:MAG: hypothetical protein AAGF96_11730 [Bacteroidota bacterium]
MIVLVKASLFFGQIKNQLFLNHEELVDDSRLLNYAKKPLIDGNGKRLTKENMPSKHSKYWNIFSLMAILTPRFQVYRFLIKKRP